MSVEFWLLRVCVFPADLHVRACVCIHIVRNTGLHGENLRSKELRSLRHVISTAVEPVHGMTLCAWLVTVQQRGSGHSCRLHTCGVTARCRSDAVRGAAGVRRPGRRAGGA